MIVEITEYIIGRSPGRFCPLLFQKIEMSWTNIGNGLDIWNI
jgi:hypothetical protein